MAITSYGYPDLIPLGSAWALIQMSLGRQYSAPFVGHCAVSKVVGGTRQSRVAAGYLGGKGILDYNSAPVTLSHDVVASGQRYDAVVLRRWVDNTGVNPAIPFRSEFAIVKGTSARAIPAVTQNPGTLDEQVISLQGFKAGQTEAFDSVDLRAIAEEPGIYTIYDDLALQTIDRVGVMAYNANTGITYRRVYAANLAREWQRVWDAPNGVRPRIQLARSTPFGGDLPSGTTVGLYGGLTTTKTGAADTHLASSLGSTVLAQAQDGQVAYIQAKTDGVYAFGARLEMRSSALFRGALHGNMANSGGQNALPVDVKTVPVVSGAASAILNVGATIFLPAGARFNPVLSIAGAAVRIQEWNIWMTRLSD